MILERVSHVGHVAVSLTILLLASIVCAALVPVGHRIEQLTIIPLRQEVTRIILLSLCVIIVGMLDGHYVSLLLKLLWIYDLAL